jgi:outer membrane protein OmpA-like peptidoglycan-associated protein
MTKIVAAISVVMAGGIAYAEDTNRPYTGHPDVDADVDVDVNKDTGIRGDVDVDASKDRDVKADAEATRGTDVNAMNEDRNIDRGQMIDRGDKNMKEQARSGSLVKNKAACKSAEVFFRFDSAALATADDSVLQPLVDELNKYENTTIVLDGFADPRGTDAYNVRLSGRRADAVRGRLVAMGAPRDRIVLGLHGERGAQQESYAQDRRVTAWITRNSTAQIINHEKGQNVAALVLGSESLADLGGEQRQQNVQRNTQQNAQTNQTNQNTQGPTGT